MKQKEITEEATDIEIKNIRHYAFVSKRALEKKHIGYCYREYPETKIDSGWRFLSGDEDEDYLSEPTNSISIYPEEMFSINPELKAILDSPINSEFEWDNENKLYLEII